MVLQVEFGYYGSRLRQLVVVDFQFIFFFFEIETYRLDSLHNVCFPTF